MEPHGWRVQVASDVIRDGLGLELISPTGDIAGEIFRCDADHSVSMTMWSADIPGETLAWFRSAAPRELGDTYEDGRLIDWTQIP
jgi:hypothetical protein